MRYAVRKNKSLFKEDYPWCVFDRSIHKQNWLYKTRLEAKVAADGLNAMWEMYSFRIKYMMEEFG